MGGASRRERRRKQEAMAARTSAPRARPAERDPRRTTFIAVSVVAVVALVVGAAVLLTRGGGDDPAVAPTYSASAAGGVVTAGNGPLEIDVYTDYLCPFCERFEQNYGDELTTALNAGQITVRYHLVSILDERTEPAGYSTRAAGAALCAADVGVFPGYNARLWAEQPPEGGAGLTDEQLVGFGTGLGAPAEFGTCVGAGVHTADVAAVTEAALADPVAAPEGRFGTPTVVMNGAQVDTSDSAWLQEALASR